MDRPIGEVFTIEENGKEVKLRVEEGDGLRRECALQDHQDCQCELFCNANNRSDKTDVIAVLVEE